MDDEDKKDVMMVIIHYAVVIAAVYFGIVQPLALGGYWTWWSAFWQFVIAVYAIVIIIRLQKYGK